VFLAAGLLVLGLLFRELLTLLLAVLITVIIAIGLSAAASKLERRQVPRPIGALVTLLAAVSVLVGILALIIPPFIDQTNAFVDDVPGIVEDLRDSIHDVTGANPREITDSVQGFTEGYTDDPARLIGPITSIGLSVAGVFGGLIIMLIIMLIVAYYIAIRPEPLVDGIRRIVPPAHRGRVDHIMGRLHASWLGWMRGVAIDMLLSGVLLYIGLSIIGLEFAIFFAVLTALFSVVPYFGAIASGIPPVLFAFTDSPGKALLVIVVYTIVQQVEGNLTIPMVMSRAVNLHPAVIAIGVLVVGRLFGFVGLIVAVPILSMITILVEELWVKPIEEAHRRAGDAAIVKA